jgi:hypothetical protein
VLKSSRIFVKNLKRAEIFPSFFVVTNFSLDFFEKIMYNSNVDFFQKIPRKKTGLVWYIEKLWVLGILSFNLKIKHLTFPFSQAGGEVVGAPPPPPPVFWHKKKF